MLNRRVYPVKFRERAVRLIKSGKNFNTVYRDLNIGKSTLFRWLALERETGSLAPRPKGGGMPRKIDAHGEKILYALVKEQPERTLNELAVLLKKRAKITASIFAISRTLKRAEMPKRSLAKLDARTQQARLAALTKDL